MQRDTLCTGIAKSCRGCSNWHRGGRRGALHGRCCPDGHQLRHPLRRQAPRQCQAVLLRQPGRQAQPALPLLLADLLLLLLRCSLGAGSLRAPCWPRRQPAVPVLCLIRKQLAQPEIPLRIFRAAIKLGQLDLQSTAEQSAGVSRACERQGFQAAGGVPVRSRAGTPASGPSGTIGYTQQCCRRLHPSCCHPSPAGVPASRLAAPPPAHQASRT